MGVGLLVDFLMLPCIASVVLKVYVHTHFRLMPVEALQLILPPHLAEQPKWSRFINIHGLCGHNISCDLHTEHLDRLAKSAIKCLGANKSQKTVMSWKEYRRYTKRV